MNPRERLIEVALRLFVDRGYDAVGVQEIVDAAGVTKPTLYHHFGNKRGVLDALARDADAALERRVDPALEYRHDAPADLERLIASLLDFAADEPLRMRLLLLAQHAPVESEARLALWPAWERRVTALEGFFREAAQDHGNMKGREREFTVAFFGVVLAYVVILLDGRVVRSNVDPHRIMRQFSYGIYS